MIEQKARDMFYKGRYYVPRGDAAFESGNIYFTGASERRLATASGGQPEMSATGLLSGESKKRPARLMGAQWTYYAEGYDEKMEPVVNDYKDNRNDINLRGEISKQGRDGKEELVQIWLKVYDKNGRHKRKVTTKEGAFTNSYFSSVVADTKSGLNYVEIKEGESVRYSVAINVKGSEPGKTALLATPVFDDITIFYSEGVRVISYAEQAG